MSYVIFGRAIKTEYLTLGTLFTTAAVAYGALGGKKEVSSAPKSIAERVKESVPIKAGSSEEEEFIKNFIAEAEKEASH